jgi:hypothetical protein
MKSRLSIVLLALFTASMFGWEGAWAKRKASTPGDRSKAVKLAHELEAEPLSDDAFSKRKWLIDWYEKVPDITVVMCDLLGPLPKDDHPFFPVVLSQMLFSNGAFQIEHPDKAGDKVAAQAAGLEAALNVYEILVKQIPEGRLPFLDDLLEKRAQDHLAEYVKDRTVTGCGD